MLENLGTWCTPNLTNLKSELTKTSINRLCRLCILHNLFPHLHIYIYILLSFNSSLNIYNIMGVKSVTHEVKLKVSASRMFKTVVLEILDVIPKASTSIKSIHLLQGRNILIPILIFQHKIMSCNPII